MVMKRGARSGAGFGGLIVTCLVAAGLLAGVPVAARAAAPSRQSVASLEMAAQNGVAGAQAYLGALYAAGSGVPQDYAKAAHWYRKAAAQGDAAAQVDLGLLYERGQGVAQDYATAAAWFRKAAAQGNAEAQNDLAALYQQGRGVPLDYAKAIHWYRQSAAQGNETAHSNLMALYAYLKAIGKLPSKAR